MKVYQVEWGCMAVVAITSSNERNARRYIEAVAGHAQTRLITPHHHATAVETLLDEVGGIVLTGGPDIDLQVYGEFARQGARLEILPDLDRLELRLLGCALVRDMPVLAICRGMQLLNVAFGGSLLQDVPGHRLERKDGHWASSQHSIYLSPGSKLAAILGRGGFFKVNSRHLQGLREAQKSPRLLASAYSLDDGIIEALESPGHSWVVGVQCHPERKDEVPKAFSNLFEAFAERADRYRYAS